MDVINKGPHTICHILYLLYISLCFIRMAQVAFWNKALKDESMDIKNFFFFFFLIWVIENLLRHSHSHVVYRLRILTSESALRKAFETWPQLLYRPDSR